MATPISLMNLDERMIETFNNNNFNAKNSRVTSKDFQNLEITVECVTDGWDVGEGENIEIKDTITYRVPNGIEAPISADFSITKSDIQNYYKFLIKNNVNPIMDYIYD